VHTLVTHGRYIAHPIENSRILHHGHGPEPARHAQYVGGAHVLKRRRRQQIEPRVGWNRIARFPNQIDFHVAQPRQNLRRAGQVELRDLRE